MLINFNLWRKRCYFLFENVCTKLHLRAYSSPATSRILIRQMTSRKVAHSHLRHMCMTHRLGASMTHRPTFVRTYTYMPNCIHVHLWHREIAYSFHSYWLSWIICGSRRFFSSELSYRMALKSWLKIKCNIQYFIILSVSAIFNCWN